MNYKYITMDIYLSLIITLVLFVQDCFAQVQSYDYSKEGYASIPTDIPIDAVLIRLNNNKLSSLGANAFSAYTSLTKLYLDDNEITTIDATSFSSTEISLLRLARNKLIEFPDLRAISGTLQTLDISKNDFTTMPSERSNLPNVNSFVMKNMELTEWPDFDLIGASSTSSSSKLSLSWYPEDYNITNVCHFATFAISEHVNPTGVTSAPRIVCPTGSKLKTLDLGKNNWDIDFETLSDVGDLVNLYIHENNFKEFPNLPMSLRGTLTRLLLGDNPIKRINPAFLEGYDNLETLFLYGMSLTSMSELMWNEILCNAKTITYLRLKGSFNSLAEVPPIKGALCQRSTPLKLDLTEVRQSLIYHYICI